MIDHLVFFAVRDDTTQEDVEDLLNAIRDLKNTVPGVVDLSAGEDFSGRSGGYTHAFFVRFESREGLQGYMQHPDHLAIVEKLEERTTGRIVADYEF